MTDTTAPSLDTPSTATRGASPGARLWRETWRQREFRFGLIVILVLIAASILVPLLTGIDPGKMQIKNKYLPPVFLPGGDWIDTPTGETIRVTGARLDLALDDPADDTPTDGAPAPYMETYRAAHTSELPGGETTFTLGR